MTFIAFEVEQCKIDTEVTEECNLNVCEMCVKQCDNEKIYFIVLL